MEALLALLLLMILALGLLGMEVRRRFALPVFLFAVISLSWCKLLPWGLALLIALPSLILVCDRFRQRIFIAPLRRFFQTQLPKLSPTESVALAAGDTWFERELFSGQPNWDALSNLRPLQLTDEERHFIECQVEHLCSLTNDWAITQELHDLPPNVWQYLKDERFFALIIPKKYGGLAFSAYAHAQILQKIAGISSTLAATVGVPNSLGPAELLLRYGTEAQRDYYLPRLARGEEIPCFALTNPEAGSDAAAIPDSGIVCYGEWQGEVVLGMRLSWNKRYITLAPVATLLGLAVHLRDPDQLLNREIDLGISCLLIPTHLAGVEIGERHQPLTTAFQNGPTRAKDLFVPLEYLIGGIERAGQGWQMLMESLASGRGITLPAGSVAALRYLALASGSYSRIRYQFKQPIGRFEAVEEPLARLGGLAYLTQAGANLTLSALAAGKHPALASAMMKYHCTEMARFAAQSAMDIHGGRGICMGPNNYLAPFWLNAPIAITVEGANLLTRGMIIYGQGALRCHPWLMQEMAAAQADENQESVAAFDHAFFGHLTHVGRNLARSIALGFSGGWGSLSPERDFRRYYYQQLNRLSANLALLSDAAMALEGANLKRHERFSARLGDLHSYLYLAAAALKQYQDQGDDPELRPTLEWALGYALNQGEVAIDALLANISPRPAAWLLRGCLRPLGRRVAPPSDHLDHLVAQSLQQPSALRRQLAEQLYLTPTESNPLGRLDDAFKQLLELHPLLTRIAHAKNEPVVLQRLDLLAQEALQQGWIDEIEAHGLIEAEAIRAWVINVDTVSHC